MLDKAKALKNKIGAAGAKAIRYIPNKHHEFKMDRLNKEANWLRDYNAKSKSGVVPISNVDRAKFNLIKEKYTK